MRHQCSAHPRVDRKTGEFFIFGYRGDKPVVQYTLMDKDRRLKKSFDIPITSPRMIHDFQITEKYLVIPDLPIEFNPQDAVKKNQFVFNFNKEAGSRYGILRRDASNPDDIVWFDTDVHYVFHFANSWSSTNAKGEDIVTVVAVCHKQIEIGLLQEHFDMPKNGPQTTLEKFEFNMFTKKLTRKVMLSDVKVEFPVVNQELVGYKNRYVYLANIEPRTDVPAEGKDHGFYNSVIKYDYQDEKIVATTSYGPTTNGGETFYYQRDGSSAEVEDDGYLFNCVHDWKTDQCYLMVWDAKTMALTCKAEMQERVPHGFHTFFVHESD